MPNANAHALGYGSANGSMPYVDSSGKPWEIGGKRDGLWRKLLPEQQPVINLRL
jgi:hypothetical protein